MKAKADVTYYSFHVGSVECASVFAGNGYFRVVAFFADVPPDVLNPVLTRYGITTEKIIVPFNSLLIREWDKLILIDTGTKPTTLVNSLRGQGIAPEDVDFVVLSHAHGDHYGGALSDSKPTFPNARYIISDVERKVAGERLAALLPQMVAPDNSLFEHVRFVPAPGHAPGQIAVQVQSEGETLLYTADVIAHPIHLECCGWNIISDADRTQALETRAVMLSQAADEGWWLFVYHFPFPGLCRIQRDGDCWRMSEQCVVGSN